MHEQSPSVNHPGGSVAGGSCAALSDKAIIERVKDGDFAAFELIMRRYNQRLFRVARSLLGNDEEAEDVVQEAYVHAYEHLTEFEGRAKFSTWLTRIAVHAASARRRKMNRIQLFDPDEPGAIPMISEASADDPRDHASRSETRELLQNALEQLPADLRVVFTMRLVEGLDTDETAAALDLTSANVKVRLHRARALLREKINERLGAEARSLYQFDGDRCDRIVRTVLSRLRADKW